MVNITDAPYNAVANGEWAKTTLSITSGNNVLTASDSIWAAGDVGKDIMIGPPDFGNPLITTIAGFTSATQITLTHNAASTLSAEPDHIVAWGTNNRAAFVAFRTDYAGESDVVLTIPAGVYLVGGTNADNNIGGLWDGIKSITVNATGATICGATFAIYAEAQVNNIDHTALTESVSAGATSVILLTAAEDSRFTVGEYVCLTGFDMQNSGLPTNQYRFEFLKVAAISAGVITFTTPLINTYLSTWPVYNATQLHWGGPATMYAMHSNFEHTCVVNGLTVVIHAQWSVCGMNFTFNNCTFEGGGQAGPLPTVARSVVFNNCVGDDLNMEVDKLTEVFTMTGCTWLDLTFQSSSIHHVTLDDTVILGTISGTPQRLTIRNGSSVAWLAPGPHFYGYPIELNVSDSVIASFGSETYHASGGATFKGSTNTGIEEEFSMAGGVITVPAALKLLGVAQIAITGGKLFFFDANVGTLGSFTITDVADVSGDIVVTTDWDGGFPARSYGAEGLNLVRHGAPICTFSNVTGCPEVVDLSGAPAGVPLHSYTRRTYGNDVPVTALYWQMYGRIKYIKVDVITPYTGGIGTVTAQLLFGNGAAIKMSDLTNINFDQVINLKEPGERILDATSSHAADWTGAEIGDTLADMDEAIWSSGNFRVHVTNTTGNPSSPAMAFTVEFITDQGFRAGRTFTCLFRPEGGMTRSTMLPDVFVNANVSREAFVGGVMVNL